MGGAKSAPCNRRPPPTRPPARYNRAAHDAYSYSRGERERGNIKALQSCSVVGCSESMRAFVGHPEGR